LINEKKLANSTISSIIKVIKVFINKVKSEKNEFLNLDIKNYKPTKESTSNSVALNEEEIANLITVNLQTSIHQKVRDLFLLQIYTFLRISDLKRISPESINIEEQTLIINQIKTGEKVIIPLTDFCMDILKKYNYTIPKISDQKYNYYIKDICKLAGIDNLIEVVRYSGSNRIEEKCAKYELMTSHSARRTGITLLIKRGVAPNVIMQVSGHRKIETLMKYVRITQNEAVEIIRKVWR
jgi:integrase